MDSEAYCSLKRCIVSDMHSAGEREAVVVKREGTDQYSVKKMARGSSAL